VHATEPDGTEFGHLAQYDAPRMIIAMTALQATLGLIGVFGVLFPVLIQGLVMFAVAQGIGEREQNRRYQRRSQASRL
jgi:hypothetical protein